MREITPFEMTELMLVLCGFHFFFFLDAGGNVR